MPTRTALLSEIDSQALCYAVFSQVVAIRKCHKDYANRGSSWHAATSSRSGTTILLRYSAS